MTTTRLARNGILALVLCVLTYAVEHVLPPGQIELMLLGGAVALGATYFASLLD